MCTILCHAIADRCVPFLLYPVVALHCMAKLLSTRRFDHVEHRHVVLCVACRVLAPGKAVGEGCITVAGDALHPMTANLGQGGCVALEVGALLTLPCMPESA
jgi:hypothetical protein